MAHDPSNVPNVDMFQAPYFFFSTTSEGQLLYLSPAIKDVLGFSPSALLDSQDCRWLTESATANQEAGPAGMARDSGMVTDNDTSLNIRVVSNAYGEPAVLSVRTYAEVDASDRVIALHGVAEDITKTFFEEEQFRARWNELKSIGDSLTPREREVLHLVMSGMLNKHIAQKLGLSERGIEHVRSRLLKKFSAATASEIISKAKELQLLEHIVASMVRLQSRPSPVETPPVNESP